MEFRLLIQSRMLTKKIYSNIIFPKEERYNLESQLKRASVSICLNLAEGNLFKNKNKARFFNIAKGSAMEVKECLILLEEIHEIKSFDLLEDVDSVIKQLQTLTSNLQTPK